jgi:ribosomal protein L44E
MIRPQITLRLRCSKCGVELEGKLDIHNDISVLPCLNCLRHHLHEISTQEQFDEHSRFQEFHTRWKDRD